MDGLSEFSLSMFQIYERHHKQLAVIARYEISSQPPMAMYAVIEDMSTTPGKVIMMLRLYREEILTEMLEEWKTTKRCHTLEETIKVVSESITPEG